MKKAVIFSLRSTARVFALCAVVIALSPHFVGLAQAAEGYRAFAERIVAAPPKGAVIAEDVEQAILIGLNSYRASKGRKPLGRAAPELQLAARAQAIDLLEMNSMGHTASTGHGFESRMRAILGKSMFLPAMAENAARDRRKGKGNLEKAQGLMAQWIKSPGHRKNLGNMSYVTVAIGAVRRGDEVYAVQIFVGPETKTNLFQ